MSTISFGAMEEAQKTYINVYGADAKGDHIFVQLIGNKWCLKNIYLQLFFILHAWMIDEDSGWWWIVIEPG